MPHRLTQSSTVSLLLACSPGCDPEPSVDPTGADDVEFRSEECWGGGGWQNTFLLPDGSSAGVSRKDIRSPEYHQSPNSAEALKLERVEILDNGILVDLEEIWADKAGLHGRTCETCTFGGADFLGARFHFSRQVSGEPEQRETLRIDDWHNIDLPSYRFVYDDHPAPAEPGAQVCGIADNGSYYATVYDDMDVDVKTGNLTKHKFAPTLFFACHSSAVIKAEEWGWGTYSGFDREIHEAAVRVVRADYCGDGETWTESGPVVFIQDTLGVNDEAINHVSAQLEAIWGMSGAICVNKPRLSEYEVSDVVCNETPIPVCDPTDDLTTYPGALFLTKSFEPGLTE